MSDKALRQIIVIAAQALEEEASEEEGEMEGGDEDEQEIRSTARRIRETRDAE